MAGFFSDLRLAARSLLRTPGFSFMVVLTLSLGIGATTTLVDIVRAVLVQPLPYAEPDRLVEVGHQHAERGAVYGAFSPQDFADLATDTPSLSSAAAYLFWPDQSTTNATFPGGPEQLDSAFVSPEFFATLGVAPRLGRPFTAQESVVGGPHAVILSEAAWRQFFGADPDVLGRTLSIEEQPYSVVGVMPAAFAFPARRVQIWLPLSFIGESAIPHRRDVRWLDVVARLAPGATVQAARADADRVLGRLEREYHDSNEGWGRSSIVGLQQAIVGDTRPVLLLSIVAAALVLATACVNVASGLLARGNARRREFAVRGALGARRSNLLRPLLLESALLAGAGCVFGFGLAVLALRSFARSVGALLPRDVEAQVDPALFGCVALIGLGVALGCGLLPALRSTTAAALGTRGESAAPGGRLRAAMIVGQIGLVSMLLYAALLTFTSLSRLAAVDPGVRTGDVLSFNVKFQGDRYEQPGARGRERDALLERVRAVPGVTAAAGAKTFPLGKTGEGYGFTLTDRAGVEVNPKYGALIVTPGYFQTLGIAFDRGRDFSSDGPEGHYEIIINRALARQFWPQTDPLGQRLHFGSGENARDYEIVGVVGDVRHRGLQEEAQSAVYVTMKDFERSSLTVLVRTPVPAATMFASLRAAVREVDAQLPVANMLAMSSALDTALQRPRLLVGLLSAFAVLGTAIAAIGIFGVLAYLVGRRRHELAVRMALGARPAQMLRAVLRQGIALGIGGSVIGLIGALLGAVALRHLLFGVAPLEWPALVAVLGGVALVCVLASYFPARRAASVDPNVALRET